MDSTVTTVVPAGKMARVAGITTMATAAALVMTTSTAAGVKRTLLAIRDCAQLCAVP